MHKTLEVMGYKVFAGPLTQITLSEERQVVNTINPHSYVVAKSDGLFREALHHSDVLLPDGSGIVLAAKVLKHENIRKIAGADLHAHLLQLLEERGGRCFYMGASGETLEKIKARLEREYPNITVGCYSPPYKSEFSTEENAMMLEADVLFVGMTAPKQEKWVYANKERINARLICSIGAVFDFYAGTVQRPGAFWIDWHLEWLPRLLQEPRRLWKRNLISTPLFLFDIFYLKLVKRLN